MKTKTNSFKVEFGVSSPKALQRAMWWFLSLHFDFTAREECRKLLWGDVELQRNPVQDSHEKLVWVNERGTNSQENGHQQAFLPKIYATSTVRCPIKLYKLFQNHWPKEMRQPDSLFFFCCQTRQSSWRKRNMVHEITTRKKSNWAIPFCSSRQCRHSKDWSSNHSVSKTSISRLLDASTP